MAPKAKSNPECVKVVIRCRPLSVKEKKQGHTRVVEMDTRRGVIDLTNPKMQKNEPPKQFTFDAIYDWNSKQIELYDETFASMVDSVLGGFNATIFAYGQTGTGKTYTMEGVSGSEEDKGLIPRTFEHIFNHIARSKDEQYLVRASYLEIYQEEIRDLLAKDQKKRLELKERPDTGVYVKDLSSFVTKSANEIEHVMTVGNNNRSTGATNMNEHSSRSHAIFLITVECSAIGPDGEPHIRVGKLNMVDLAGSERQGKTGSEGTRLKEATKINLSLSALGNVISALVDGKSTHIPYRDSKLTRLLQDSLGGNSKTVMVANIGPAGYNFEESITTLRYANRAKNIKNIPKINEDPKDALLREFQEEIKRLKAALEGKGGPRKSKKKKKVNAAGEEYFTEGSEDELDEDLDAIKKELEEERNRIMKDKGLASQEKEKLLKKAKKKEEDMLKEKQAHEGLNAKIKAMQSKLLIGGKNIIDHTNEQQRAIEEKRKVIAIHKQKEREMQQKLMEEEEQHLKLDDKYSSLKEEVDVKTKKLKKIFAKYQASKAEMQDLEDSHFKERNELEQTQDELTRELKLKVMIIENFIPVEEKDKIQSRCVFHEVDDRWNLIPLTGQRPNGERMMEPRPTSAVGERQPVSAYAKAAALRNPDNTRFRGENIMLVNLDFPNRTTKDYSGPSVAPRMQAALDAAFKEEDAIDIDASHTMMMGSLNKRIRNTAKKASQPKVKPKPQDASMYPQARGLVPK